jgi:Fe-S cluster biogenesis protein NfuA/nitrite reductase/ring-hydroxylating ferredoxin subunit
LSLPALVLRNGQGRALPLQFMQKDQTSQQRVHKIEELIQRIDSVADPQLRANALKLVQSLMDLHGEGLNRMLEIVAQHAKAGQTIIDNLGEDELVGGLLMLYGLHPVAFESRVLKALEKVRPYLKSHGGDVELLGVDDGIVRLQMQGSCHGCPSSAMTLKLAIEEAIYEGAPDLTEIVVDGVVEDHASVPALVPLQITRNAPSPASRNGAWEEVAGVTSLTQGSVRAIEVRGQPVLFCRLNGDFYAYACSCSNCGETMSTARLEKTTLVCPNCGARYDVLHAGRGLDQSSLQLQPFPLLMEEGQAKIALPNLATS